MRNKSSKKPKKLVKKVPRKRLPRFAGSLPDGDMTMSPRRYAAAWCDFARPFEEELGWQVRGFEPGISFFVGPDGGAPTPDRSFPLCLSIGVARRLRAVVVELCQARAILNSPSTSLADRELAALINQ